MLNLSLTEKGGPTKDLSFDKDEVSIGRVRGNDIVLPKGNVSKHHCRLFLRAGQLHIEDLHSTNGTYVNGRKIAEPTPVGAADKIFVGDFIIRLPAPALAAESSRPPQAEAGSLSTALPRRAPPPAFGSDLDDDLVPSGRAGGRGAMPPPPPPPPPPALKRDTSDIPPMSDSSFPTTINLDDDDPITTPPPKLQVPPLKPAVQPDSGLSSQGLSTPHPSPSADDGPPLPPSSSQDMDMLDASFPPSSPPQVEAPPVSVDIPPPPPPPAPAQKEASRIRSVTVEQKRPAKAGGDFPEWLSKIVEADGVTAAFFSGTNQPEILRGGKRESVSAAATDLANLGTIVRKLVGKVPRIAADAPIINATLPDGTQISALFPPTADKLCVSIRRPMAIGKNIQDLVDDGVISDDMRRVLEACVSARQNILVSGDRAACDSLLRALAWSVDRVARVSILSDSFTPPASATAWTKLQGTDDAPALLAAVVSMQPEYVIADAGMSSALGALLHECHLGLTGAILSVIARSSSDALHRLAVFGSSLGSLTTLHRIIDASVDVIVHASSLPDGSMKVTEIAEPVAPSDGGLETRSLLAFTDGAFAPTDTPCALAGKLKRAGQDVSESILIPLD